MIYFRHLRLVNYLLYLNNKAIIHQILNYNGHVGKKVIYHSYF